MVVRDSYSISHQMEFEAIVLLTAIFLRPFIREWASLGP